MPPSPTQSTTGMCAGNKFQRRAADYKLATENSCSLVCTCLPTCVCPLVCACPPALGRPIICQNPLLSRAARRERNKALNRPYTCADDTTPPSLALDLPPPGPKPSGEIAGPPQTPNDFLPLRHEGTGTTDLTRAFLLSTD